MLPAFPDKHPDTALTSFYRRKFSSPLYNYEAHLLSVSRYLNFLRTRFSSILLIYIFFYLLVKLSGIFNTTSCCLERFFAAISPRYNNFPEVSVNFTYILALFSLAFPFAASHENDSVIWSVRIKNLLQTESFLISFYFSYQILYLHNGLPILYVPLQTD